MNISLAEWNDFVEGKHVESRWRFSMDAELDHLSKLPT